MKNLVSWDLFESLQSQTPIPIEDFLDRIGIDPSRKSKIVDWWKENRSRINIYFFPFATNKPIAGVFLGENDAAINSSMRIPSFIFLMILLHESRHADQHKEGKFMDGYFQSVLYGDKGKFMKSYKELEKDANDFTIEAMKELGFENEMRREDETGMFRGNEEIGDVVYQMISADIEKFKPKDFFDLLRKQIGLKD